MVLQIPGTHLACCVITAFLNRQLERAHYALKFVRGFLVIEEARLLNDLSAASVFVVIGGSLSKLPSNMLALQSPPCAARRSRNSSAPALDSAECVFQHAPFHPIQFPN